MPKQIDVGEKVRRGHRFFIAPSAIIVDPNLNGRHDSISPAAVRRLADDIRANGQLQDVIVRRLHDQRVQVVAGYHRREAGLLLEQEDPTFRLKCDVIDCNEEEAFGINQRENLLRHALTPIDVAFNLRRATEHYGHSLKEAVAVYDKSEQWGADHLKLLALSTDARQQVSAGELSVKAALLLARLPEREAAEVLAEAKAEAEPPPALPATGEDLEIAASIDAAKRARKVNRAVLEKTRAKGIKMARPDSELRKLIRGRNGKFSRALAGYLAGTLGETDFVEALDAADAAIA